ncbi:unnamed protein product [Urochloa decumbens]|uniref:Uncharacterized protein n=1 Tax=Urochloa decumbens TaxID=240449 RepID=A0ABC9FI82_9POAL
MTMKSGGGQGSGAGAAATTMALLVALLMLVATSMRADAVAVPRRLGDPGPNHCSHDTKNQGQGCHVPPSTGTQPRRLISVSKVSAGPSGCTYDPNAPPGKCPPTKAP